MATSTAASPGVSDAHESTVEIDEPLFAILGWLLHHDIEANIALSNREIT